MGFAKSTDMQMMINYIIKALFIFSTVPFLLAERIPLAKKLPIIPYYQDTVFTSPKQVGKLENKVIDEASGIAFSRTIPGIIYTHNDSGGEPYVYMIDTLGKSKGEIKLKGIQNRDWEDIAVGPGPMKDVSYIYIGEIGDNLAIHDEVMIYRIPEPKNWTETATVAPEKLKLTYPDGPRDSETLMVDPISKDIFILSKRDSANILYRIPNSAFEKGEYEMEKVMELPFTMSVAGDISADGSQILIKNYFAVFYWLREKGESIPEALKRKPLVLPYKPEPQGEAIAFKPSGKSYFTLSEKRFGIDPVLYRYDKK